MLIKDAWTKWMYERPNKWPCADITAWNCFLLISLSVYDYRLFLSLLKSCLSHVERIHFWSSESVNSCGILNKPSSFQKWQNLKCHLTGNQILADWRIWEELPIIFFIANLNPSGFQMFLSSFTLFREGVPPTPTLLLRGTEMRNADWAASQAVQVLACSRLSS